MNLATSSYGRNGGAIHVGSIEGERSRLVSVLKGCWDLGRGKHFHSLAILSGLSADTLVGSNLISMYVRCGSLNDAQEVFDSMLHKDVDICNSLIQGYVQNGQSQSALAVFDGMEEAGIAPDARSYVSALKACADLPVTNSKWLEKAKAIHSKVVIDSCWEDKFVKRMLWKVYDKCGSMKYLRNVFDDTVHQDVASWNCLIQSCVHRGEYELAFELFNSVGDADGCLPDVMTYSAALVACRAGAKEAENSSPSKRISKWLQRGREIHSQAVISGCCCLYIDNILIGLYRRCNRMVDARSVFDNMAVRDTGSWNTLLQGYLAEGQSELVLQLFSNATMEDAIEFELDSFTYCAVLAACGSIASRRSKSKWLEMAKAIHSQAMKDQLECLLLQNKLVTTYADCGSMLHARAVFDRMQDLSCVVSWNGLIQGYVDNGMNDLALEIFDRIEEVADDEVLPNSRTYVAALMACKNLLVQQGAGSSSKWLLEKVKRIHSEAAFRLSFLTAFVMNMLMETYGKLEKLAHARSVFDINTARDRFTWSTLLQSYVDNGEDELALDLFQEQEEENEEAYCTRSLVVYGVLFRACGNLGSSSKHRIWLEKGKALHSQAIYCCGCDLDDLAKTGIVHMYGRCESMVHAQSVFDSVVNPDVVAWTCLISGYVENGENDLALSLVARMDLDGVALEAPTFVEALQACRNLMALESGRWFHAEIRSLGLEQNLLVASCLVDMYGKCGSLEAAKSVFEGIAGGKDVKLWNSLIGAYAQQGLASKVFELFEQMRERGISPNEVTFTHILSACSHAGLTEEGKRWFHHMSSKFGTRPQIIHCNCVVDLLGRANRLEEALQFAETMPVEPNSVTWMTLLGACCKWKNIEVGKAAYRSLLSLDRGGNDRAATYNLMANLYTTLPYELKEHDDQQVHSATAK